MTEAQLIEAIEETWRHAVYAECGEASPTDIATATQAYIDAETAYNQFKEAQTMSRLQNRLDELSRLVEAAVDEAQLCEMQGLYARADQSRWYAELYRTEYEDARRNMEALRREEAH